MLEGVFGAAATPGKIDIVLYLLADLAIIIVLCRLFGAAARRLGQPSVIGEILAGIVFGPTILGRINESWPSELFPAQVPLEPIAQLGLVFFMFLVGLELDPALLRSQGKRALQISLSGVLAPLALGILVGTALYSTNNGGQFFESGSELPSRAAFSVFIGAAMCITAFPVLARILVETGLYRTPVGTAVLCAGAVDDVIAWILLAGVVGTVESGSPLEAGRAFLLTAGFVLVMVFVVRRLLGFLAARHEATGHLSIDMVAIVLAGVLLSAFATEWIGIHAIFGAFVFGLIMPKRSGMTRELTDKIEDFTVVVLLPVFFVVVGLRTNLLTLDSPALIGWLLLILAVAVAGKFLGCGIAARLTGSSLRDSVVVGSLMNTRGLTELVILSIGFNLGVLSDRTLAMMVIMALTTTVMAAPIVNRLLPAAQRTRELAPPDEAPTTLSAARILVAVGEARHARILVDVAIKIAGDRRPAELILVRLITPPRGEQFRSGLAEESLEIDAATEMLQALASRTVVSGISVRTLSFLSTDLGRDLASLADEQQCDTVVLGWHRQAMPSRFGASPLRRVLSAAPCDVAVLVDTIEDRPVAPGNAGMLVVLTGGSHDLAAITVAGSLARQDQIEVDVAGYLGNGLPGGPEAASRDLGLQAIALARASGQPATPHFEGADAEGEFIGAAAGANIAVIGAGDDWQSVDGFGRAVTAFVRAAPCPVLVVRGATGVGAPEVRRSAAAADWPFLSPPGQPPVAPALELLPGAAQLERLDGWGRPVETVGVTDVLTIGRLPANRLALVEDNLVSRNHAVVETRDGAYHLRDVGSRNGTRVWRAGEWNTIVDEELHDGDLVVIGANVFRFVEPVAEEAPDGSTTTATR